MCAAGRGRRLKDVFPSAEPHLGDFAWWGERVLDLAAGVYALVDADDPLRRLLRAQLVRSVLHSVFFVDTALARHAKNSQLVPRR